MSLAKRHESVMKLESLMREMPQVALEVEHCFSDGVYARILYIPKGTLLTGKIHKTEHLNILAKGRISVSNFGEAREMVAPLVYSSPPGTKRAGYALEDSVWITVHVTDETDLEKIEAEVIADNFDTIGHDTVAQIEEL